MISEVITRCKCKGNTGYINADRQIMVCNRCGLEINKLNKLILRAQMPAELRSGRYIINDERFWNGEI